MKKIGILTLPLHSNYGGILQAACLYAHLRQLGNHVVLLRKEPHRSPLRRLIYTALSITPYQNISGIREREAKRRIHLEFLERSFPNKSAVATTSQELAYICEDEKLDAVVVGSDQVWRFDYINDGQHNAYFLDFVPKDIAKIAYSASFGSDSISSKLDPIETARLLKAFSAISCREDMGVEICRKLLNFPVAAHTIDPTLLVGREFFGKFLKPSMSSNPKLVTYILDRTEKKDEIIKAFGAAHPEVHVTQLNGSSGYNDALSIEAWVSEFHSASYVITDSYHGMVFSIIFGKPFIAIKNDGRGSARFHSLLEQLNIENKLFSENDPVLEAIAALQKHIDYQAVEATLRRYREDSITYLNNAIASI